MSKVIREIQESEPLGEIGEIEENKMRAYRNLNER